MPDEEGTLWAGIALAALGAALAAPAQASAGWDPGPERFDVGQSSAVAILDTPPGFASLGPMAQPTTRGYLASKDQLSKRLRRIEGQVGGIERMVDEERYCIDILTQISAVQAALDKVALGLLDDHTKSCVVAAKGKERPERAEELMGAVGRLMRRG